MENAEGPFGLRITFVVCPNEECKKTALEARLVAIRGLGSTIHEETLKTWQLLPPSKARPFPDYIPQALREDYGEACLIADLSPNASATLARRCLQGIVRDFWGVEGRTLYDEIEQFKDKKGVDPVVWKAMDAVRQMGNVGAHMQKDINLIVDVDPDEARLLARLIEMLFRDCYIARHERQIMLEQITEAAEAKKPPSKDEQ